MQDKPSSESHSCSKHCSHHMMWWTTLIVAVLAVPAFGFIIASIIPIKGVGEIVVFMSACWFCTFLGMKLMQMPSMSDKVGTQNNKK